MSHQTRVYPLYWSQYKSPKSKPHCIKIWSLTMLVHLCQVVINLLFIPFWWSTWLVQLSLLSPHSSVFLSNFRLQQYLCPLWQLQINTTKSPNLAVFQLNIFDLKHYGGPYLITIELHTMFTVDLWPIPQKVSQLSSLVSSKHLLLITCFTWWFLEFQILNIGWDQMDL